MSFEYLFGLRSPMQRANILCLGQQKFIFLVALESRKCKHQGSDGSLSSWLEIIARHYGPIERWPGSLCSSDRDKALSDQSLITPFNPCHLLMCFVTKHNHSSTGKFRDTNIQSLLDFNPEPIRKSIVKKKLHEPAGREVPHPYVSTDGLAWLALGLSPGCVTREQRCAFKHHMIS